MADKKRKVDLKGAFSQWEQSTLADTLKRAPERQEKFITASSDEVNRLYTPLDLEGFDYLGELGLPGEYPYTRAIHATG
jgi:methylmalonyl-CoA mutase N-terminal domain/subunit